MSSTPARLEVSLGFLSINQTWLCEPRIVSDQERIAEIAEIDIKGEEKWPILIQNTEGSPKP